MHLLPEFHQLFEVLRCSIQNFPYVAAFRVTADRIITAGKSYRTIKPKVNDDLGVINEAVCVARFMIFGV
jgi:hypothetical protein